ncbi:hypothetical protein NLU13_2745 [Sarocladium strictum]|uniref:acetyl-CoA carboxylase n=1 Tax=Sarocladium strictum TaxID=5046 RepID=A0AA39GKQ2_SARSR|nr:hypothetical protein NLU13_2745 [Sarocladium strictum]
MSAHLSFAAQASTANLKDPASQANQDSWGQILERLEENLQAVSAEGTEVSLKRHQERGQLLARDRVALLLDPDSPFLELGAFAGFGNENSTPCANIIAGIGNVVGRPCLLMSHIPTQSGGAWNEMTVLKVNRIMEIASENDLPLISLVQSAGVFLPQQFRVFHKGGQLFYDLAVRTQNGKPSCAIVFGSSTAGGAYHPALSDYTIFVENQAQAFLGGPPLVKMATGEVIEAEELGGAKVHATLTGLADQMATDEFDAIRLAREWVASLQMPANLSMQRTIEVCSPRYPIDDILSLVNPDIRKPFNMKEVVLRLVDDSRLAVFKELYGPSLMTAWAYIHGFKVGIVANQFSVINPQEAAKGAQFIRLCNQQNTPIVFLHNVTGFMVGAKAEHAGIIKAGAQLVSAVSCSKVPHISIIMGASYGAGNYAMCGRAYKPRFLFTWPTGRCSVMGPDQLAGVMEQIQSAKAKANNYTPEQVKQTTAKFKEQVTKDAECYSTSAALIDDGVIDPRDTRDVLGMCLEIVGGARTDASAGANPQREELFVAPLPDSGRSLRSVLIANRGEIACRVIATCRKLNIKTIAIYVEEDIKSRHVLAADESICLGSIEDHAVNPFLSIELLVKTALDAGADAIHPGYGYLSENGSFATQVREAGMIFIGPTAAAMNTLGDKRSSKAYLLEHAPDIPLIPGFSGASQQLEELEQAASNIGFPVMLKASAGGGGKGMRIIREKSQLRTELERAQSEAQRFFGSSDCILEKYIERSKHVEVQIMGDSHGNVVSFFERECSIQRRHQKVVEESPCPFLTPETRRAMSDCAVRIAKLIGYENAGTVEFVLDVQTGKFYFLEVNARLQVEHPITEEVTGFDLVSLQLFVAAGGNLSEIPEAMNVSQSGHAIECRLCAEDPKANFFPDNGTIHLWQPADGLLGPGRDVRYETSVESGSPISIYFDPMIAKLIVWAPTRKLAIDKMASLLAETACIGIKTNQFFMRNCLLHPAFQDPEYTTGFISENLPSLLHPALDERAQSVQRLSTVIPSLLLREIEHRQHKAPQRSFTGVRRQFRNQRLDKANVHCDIVTAFNDAGTNDDADRSIDQSFLYLPFPQTHSDSPNARLYEAIPLPSNPQRTASDGKPLSAAAEVTALYNDISNILRTRHKRAAETVDIQVHRWEEIQVKSQNQSPLRESARALTLNLSVSGTSVRTHCVVLNGTSLDRTQRIICHLPQLGKQLEYERDSILSYIDKCRSSVTVAADSQRVVKAPMPCKVLSILKKPGEEVKVGETIMVIESMKMEVSITASAAGSFESSRAEGQAVEEGHVLCEIQE